MQTMSAQALRMAVVNAASNDPAFLQALANDGAKAVAAKFGNQPLNVQVSLESPSELPILIPEKTDKLARSLAHIATEVGDRKPSRSEFEAIVIHRAWTDASFLKDLRANPQGTIDTVLKKYESGGLPQGVTVRLFEEKPGECLIVLPTPNSSAELSDAQLEAVAGGVIGIDDLIAGAIVGAVAGEVVHQIMN
ncbi:MAG: NHLP leader peptide family RiPP precursor [Vicinamibacteria bacterium]